MKKKKGEWMQAGEAKARHTRLESERKKNDRSLVNVLKSSRF